MEVYLTVIDLELKDGGAVSRYTVFDTEKEAKKFVNRVYTEDLKRGYKHLSGSPESGKCCVEDIHLNRISYNIYKKPVFKNQEGVLI